MTDRQPLTHSNARDTFVALDGFLGKITPSEGAARAARLGQVLWRVGTALGIIHTAHTANDWATGLDAAHEFLRLPPHADLSQDMRSLARVLRKEPGRALRFVDDTVKIHSQLRTAAAFLNQLPRTKPEDSGNARIFEAAASADPDCV